MEQSWQLIFLKVYWRQELNNCYWKRNYWS